MKLLSFIKVLAGFVLVAGGITAAVVFSDVNTVRYPKVNVLTKEWYQQIRSSQNDESNVVIDYNSLPGTNHTILDIVKGSSSIGNGNYIFFFGSDAYQSSAQALFGWDNPVPQNTYDVAPRTSSSIMLTLYDLFYNDDNYDTLVDYGIEDINPIFLNYIDVSWNRQTLEAQELMNYRMTSIEGTYYPNNATKLNPGESMVWKVGTDIANIQWLPVVRGSTEFNYQPTESFYEFRPNAEEDTEYEKVYFRDQSVVKTYNTMSNYLTNFLSAKSLSFSDNGTILAAKKDDKGFSFTSITNFDDDIQINLRTIVKFYNPDIELSDDEIVPPGEGDSGESSGDETRSNKNNSSKTSSNANVYHHSFNDIHKENIKNVVFRNVLLPTRKKD